MYLANKYHSHCQKISSYPKALRKEVTAYVENLATVTCNVSGDGTWHGCGKSGFTVGGKTPQATTVCETPGGCGKNKKDKKGKAPATTDKWVTRIHPKGAPNDFWVKHDMTTPSDAAAPSTQTIAREILAWLKTQ